MSESTGSIRGVDPDTDTTLTDTTGVSDIDLTGSGAPELTEVAKTATSTEAGIEVAAIFPVGVRNNPAIRPVVLEVRLN